MNTDIRALSQSEDRRARAADWLFRLRNPEISPDEIRNWMAWCDAAPENKQEFAIQQAIWQHSGGLDARSMEPIATPNRWKWAVAAAVALLIGGSMVWKSNAPLRKDVAFATSTGVNRDIVLQDGTAVTLAAGSRLTSRLTAQRREIALERGEAFFRVHKDASRPFIVRALGTTVTAVGTAFNVRAEQGVVKVAVTEGLVDVEQSLANRVENVRLGAGRQVTMTLTESRPMVAPVDAERATAWRTGTLEFLREPLSSVVAAVNRYAATPIELGSADLSGYNFTGTVSADRVEEWLHGLPDIYPVEIREQPGESVVIERRGR